MKNLLTQIDEIFAELNFTDKFGSPIASDEFITLSEQLPFQIPKQLEEFYKWHNGITEFIPDRNFLAFKDAIDNYKYLVRSLKDFENNHYFCEFKETYLPISYIQESWYLIDCGQNSGMSIHYLCLEESYEEGNVCREYDSFEQMLRIFIDSYLSGAFYVDEDDDFRWDWLLFKKIEDRHFSAQQKEIRNNRWNKICADMEVFMNDPSGFSIGKKRNLIFRLYTSDDTGAIEYLSMFLKYSDDTRLTEYLSKFLMFHNADIQVLAKAIFGLGYLKAREYLPNLLSYLQHPDKDIRNATIDAIGNLITPYDKLLLKPLLQLISDKSVRFSVIDALGKLKSQNSVPKLIEQLGSDNGAFRCKTIKALGKIGGAVALEALSEYRDKVLPENLYKEYFDDEEKTLNDSIKLIIKKSHCYALTKKQS